MSLEKKNQLCCWARFKIILHLDILLHQHRYLKPSLRILHEKILLRDKKYGIIVRYSVFIFFEKERKFILLLFIIIIYPINTTIGYHCLILS